MKKTAWWVPSCVGAFVLLVGCAVDEPDESTTEQQSVAIGNYYGIVQSLNPVGYWRLGESSGSVLVDNSSSPTNGTYSGYYALGRPGAVAVDNNTSAAFGTSAFPLAGKAVVPDRDAYSLTQDWDSYGGLSLPSTSTTWGTAPNGRSWTCDLSCAGNYYSRDLSNGLSIVPGPVGDAYQQGRDTTLLDGEMQIMVDWNAHASGGPLTPVALIARRVDALNYVSAELVEDPNTSALTLRLVQTTNASSQVLASAVIGYSSLPGAEWWLVRFRFDGTTLTARAWPEINTEPTVWLVEATVTGVPAAGRVAVRYANLDGNARPTVSFKEFWVQAAGFTHSMFIYVSSTQDTEKTFPFGKAAHEDEWGHDNDEYYFRYHHASASNQYYRGLKSYVFNLSGGKGAGVSADYIDEDRWHHVVTMLDNGDWRDPTAGITMWVDGRNITNVNSSGRKYGSFGHCVDECVDSSCHDSDGNTKNCWMITPLNGTQPLKLGTIGDSFKRFIGGLDEVAIFNKKLSQSQIQDLYNTSCQPNPNGKTGGLSATASSMEAPQYAPSYAIDGSLYTRWSSAFSDNQSITIDLGSQRPIEKVNLIWETAYASAYDIKVSDNGIIYDQVKRVYKSSASSDMVYVYRTARFIRMQGVTRATQWGYSLWEFEVFTCDRVPVQ